MSASPRSGNVSPCWEGRPASLLPVTWLDGWPVIGNVGPDGIGTMEWAARKPVENGPLLVPQSDDDFSGPRLEARILRGVGYKPVDDQSQPPASRWLERKRFGVECQPDIHSIQQ